MRGLRALLPLAVIAVALSSPTRAQEQALPLPPINPPKTLALTSPDHIAGKIGRVGDGCQLMRYAPQNGLESISVHVPWRGTPFAYLVGTTEIPLQEMGDDYMEGRRWTIRNARTEALVALDRFPDLWEADESDVEVPQVDLDIGEDARPSLHDAIAAGDMLLWRSGDDILAEFPAIWLDLGDSEWTTCRAELGEYLLNRRSPDGAATDRPVPIGNIQAWIRDQDYPSRSLRNGEEGVSQVRLTIDEYGYPADCEVIESSGYAGLDEAACRTLMRRARYYPARDAQDRPMAAEVRQPVRWQMED